MPTVKICGLKDEATLSAIVHLPIDHIGFVFAPSKRQITSEQAGALVRLLADRRERGLPVPLTFGVFVNPTMEQLADVLREAPLDVVQLHGSESPEFCRSVRETFNVQVYRVSSVKHTDAPEARQDSAETALNPYIGTIDGLMVDTAGGGTGKTFEWNKIPEFQTWARKQNIPLLVAGGLNLDNVGDLLEAYMPDGVDVSSGVETDGMKDIAKITAFVERVKRHESHASA